MSRVHEPLTETVLADGFLAGEVVADPLAHLAELRAKGPLSWNEAGGYWVASQVKPVQLASVDPRRFTSTKGILAFEIGVEYPSPPTMMHTDPPQHTHLRSIIAPAFRPSAMRALEERLRGHVARLLASVEPGSEAEAVEALTLPFPLVVICELLGVPWEDWERFRLWSDAAIPGAMDITEAERQTHIDEMLAYLMGAVYAKRSNPADDVLSLLATGEGVTDADTIIFVNQLLVAGNETTRNSLSSGLIGLSEHPEQFARLRADRSLLHTAVEEVLRWSTPVYHFMRTAVDDNELCGTPISAGDPVVLFYWCANRDEVEFGPTADRFDVGRTPNHHVAFGHGPHFCVGAALARLEIAVVLDELATRYGSLEPAGAAVRTRSSVIAGVTSVPLYFGA